MKTFSNCSTCYLFNILISYLNTSHLQFQTIESRRTTFLDKNGPNSPCFFNLFLTPSLVSHSCQISSQIHSPWRGDKVNSGIGLSYRPDRLHRLAGRYDYIPQSRTMNLATGSSAPRILAVVWIGPVPPISKHSDNGYFPDLSLGSLLSP
jgi:hypothetical protein